MLNIKKKKVLPLWLVYCFFNKSQSAQNFFIKNEPFDSLKIFRRKSRRKTFEEHRVTTATEVIKLSIKYHINQFITDCKELCKNSIREISQELIYNEQIYYANIHEIEKEYKEYKEYKIKYQEEYVVDIKNNQEVYDINMQVLREVYKKSREEWQKIYEENIRILQSRQLNLENKIGDQASQCLEVIWNNIKSESSQIFSNRDITKSSVKLFSSNIEEEIQNYFENNEEINWNNLKKELYGSNQTNHMLINRTKNQFQPQILLDKSNGVLPNMVPSITDIESLNNRILSLKLPITEFTKIPVLDIKDQILSLLNMIDSSATFTMGNIKREIDLFVESLNDILKFTEKQSIEVQNILESKEIKEIKIEHGILAKRCENDLQNFFIAEIKNRVEREICEVVNKLTNWSSDASFNISTHHIVTQTLDDINRVYFLNLNDNL